MAYNLFGEYFEDKQEYSNRLIAKGMTCDILKVRYDFNVGKKDIRLFFDVAYSNYNNTKHKKLDVPGLYAIYDGIPSKDNCLYVGYSDKSCWTRIYRFMLELLSIKRVDMRHSAAIKARKNNISPDNIHVIVLARDNFPERKGHFVNVECLSDIDEYIAKKLKSRFNKVIK